MRSVFPAKEPHIIEIYIYTLSSIYFIANFFFLIYIYIFFFNGIKD